MATLIIKPGAGYWDLTHYPMGGCFHRAPRNGEPVEIIKLIETIWQKGERYVIGMTADGRKISVDDNLTIWKPTAEENKPFPEEMEGANHYDN
jgi:hypothetical protein